MRPISARNGVASINVSDVQRMILFRTDNSFFAAMRSRAKAQVDRSVLRAEWDTRTAQKQQRSAVYGLERARSKDMPSRAVDFPKIEQEQAYGGRSCGRLTCETSAPLIIKRVGCLTHVLGRRSRQLNFSVRDGPEYLVAGLEILLNSRAWPIAHSNVDSWAGEGKLERVIVLH